MSSIFKIVLFASFSLLLNAGIFTQELTGNGYHGEIKLKLKDKFSLIDSTANNTGRQTKSGSQLTQHKYKINYLKFGAITGVTAGAFLWLHNYQKNAWWSGQRGKFHFQNDWDYAMSADKTGHFFDGALIQAIYRGALEWAGFSPTASVWLGAAFSIAYMTDVEIEDGFATDWGFSMGDQICNVTGALYPVAQYYWKPLRSFNFKWSYLPSEEITSGKKNGAFLDDYNGQTMWLSINVHDFLGKKAKNFWPDYLNVVTGYGVNHYTEYDKRYADYYVGLDLNWERIIPGNSKFMIWFKNIINHFRFLPLPALRFNKDGVQYIVNW
ncbi:MAG TPA: DUF2279 domain-containing protein [Ignavibacteria bacterium]|nr:DUF2279 domain-containing protein [Ignavibacteria bacterium]HMQ99928.1 DUF2279 domain-containing protein [Ignavibacteria bacterium]